MQKVATVLQRWLTHAADPGQSLSTAHVHCPRVLPVSKLHV